MNIILYPRVYNKRGADSSHSVLGITQEGELVNVKLRLDKVTENSPSIKEFSRQDRKATKVCVAEPYNCPEQREGVILFTQCFLDDKQTGNEKTYVAKWATVLCEDKDSNPPILGVGRLVIPKDFEINKELEKQYRSIADTASESELAELKERINKTSKYSFGGVIYDNHKTQTFIHNEIESAQNFVESVIDSAAKNHVVGGFAIRILTKDHKVVPSSYLEVFQKFNPVRKEYTSPKETAEMYFGSAHAKSAFASSDFFIDIMPLRRFNGGKYTTKHYSKDTTYPIIKSIYSTNKGNIKVCNVAIKSFNFIDPQNDYRKILLDRMHAMSEPLGHPMRLSKDGTMSLLLRGESSFNKEVINSELFFWCGMDENRVSLNRNESILYLLDTGSMPERSIGAPKIKVKLQCNEQSTLQCNDNELQGNLLGSAITTEEDNTPDVKHDSPETLVGGIDDIKESPDDLVQSNVPESDSDVPNMEPDETEVILDEPCSDENDFGDLVEIENQIEAQLNHAQQSALCSDESGDNDLVLNDAEVELEAPYIDAQSDTASKSAEDELGNAEVEPSVEAQCEADDQLSEKPLLDSTSDNEPLVSVDLISDIINEHKVEDTSEPQSKEVAATDWVNQWLVDIDDDSNEQGKAVTTVEEQLDINKPHDAEQSEAENTGMAAFFNAYL